MQDYPEEIIPQQGWRQNLDAESIISSQPKAWIAHRIEGDICSSTECGLGDDVPALTKEALPDKRMPNLSMCLLGATFLPRHFAYIQKNEGKEKWEKQDKRQTDTTDNYQTTDNFFVVAWELRQLHNKAIPYKRTFTSKSNYTEAVGKIERHITEKWEDLKEDSNGRTTILKATMKANHAPVRLNYWHFTIDIYPEDNSDKPLTNISGNWRKHLAVNARDCLRRTFFIVEDNDDIPQIDKAAYSV